MHRFERRLKEAAEVLAVTVFACRVRSAGRSSNGGFGVQSEGDAGARPASRTAL